MGMQVEGGGMSELTCEVDVAMSFQDLGQEMSYHVIERVWDAEEYAASQEISVLPVRGLVTGVKGQADVELGGHATREELHVLIREEELPEDCPSLTDRVVMGELEYGVMSFLYEPALKVYELVLNRIGKVSG